jgi:hypothetical protein
MAAIPTEGRVFVAQLTREIRKRETIGAALLARCDNLARGVPCLPSFA